MLPLRIAPIKARVLGRQREVFDLEARDELSGFLFPDGAVSFLGHAFYVPNYLDALSLLLEIAALDQYQAVQFISKDAIVIDAGANIGAFSTYASHLAPDGHVYAFEPVASTFSLMEKNGREYPNLTCLKLGLGDEITEKKISNRIAGNLGNAVEDSPLFRASMENDLGWEKVSITTVDAFISQRKVQRVDLIKIDTEGYEARILRGAAETIKKFRPVIVMSAYHTPEDKTELPKLVKSICPEYSCVLVKRVEEIVVCQAKKA